LPSSGSRTPRSGDGGLLLSSGSRTPRCEYPARLSSGRDGVREYPPRLSSGRGGSRISDSKLDAGRPTAGRSARQEPPPSRGGSRAREEARAQLPLRREGRSSHGGDEGRQRSPGEYATEDAEGESLQGGNERPQARGIGQQGCEAAALERLQTELEEALDKLDTSQLRGVGAHRRARSEGKMVRVEDELAEIREISLRALVQLIPNPPKPCGLSSSPDGEQARAAAPSQTQRAH
jgi:hypothetical protein